MKRFLPLLLLLAACESVVDVPEPPHTPRVALRYTLKSDPADISFEQLAAQQSLFVSNSQRVFDTGDLRGRADATVEIRDAGGTVVERFRPNTGQGSVYAGQVGYYLPTLGLVPRPGASYTLRATLPGLEAAESSLTFPAPPTVSGGSYAPLPNSGGGQSQSRRGRLTLTIPDDPNTANYYIAFAQLLDARGVPIAYGTVSTDDDNQAANSGIGQFKLSSPGQQYRSEPFSDAGANGQVLTLASDVRFYELYCPPNSPCPQPIFMEVTVSCLTPDAYQFYLSRRRYYDAGDNPFAEPAPLASNLRNGFGIFAGSADAKYRVRL